MLLRSSQIQTIEALHVEGFFEGTAANISKGAE